MLVKRLILDAQNEKQYLFALAYLDFRPFDSEAKQSIFARNLDLHNDTMRIVATHIVARHIDEEWIVECLKSLLPSLPRSIMAPYFLKIANEDDEKINKVLGRLRFILYLPHGDGDFDRIKNLVPEMLPALQKRDARNNIHLFDSPNEAVAESASFVFSMIYNIPKPENMTRAEEKAFWQAKMNEKQ